MGKEKDLAIHRRGQGQRGKKKKKSPPLHEQYSLEDLETLRGYALRKAGGDLIQELEKYTKKLDKNYGDGAYEFTQSLRRSIQLIAAAMPVEGAQMELI